jgi:dienelactone hydrolase
MMKSWRGVLSLLPFFLSGSSALAQLNVPPYNLWTDSVLSAIRDRSTLEESTAPGLGYTEVFFTSNPSANWFDSTPPYNEHRGGKIRIHGYLAVPSSGGPYPAIVIGHGHGGEGDPSFASLVAMQGYVALAIDGPRAGQSTGGPEDTEQAWISVDKGPEYGYLYHYGYAAMRALTLLEALAAKPGNPFRIDPNKFGVLGASMGGIMTTYVNGIDDRIKGAIIMASAGNWQHTLHYPNSWLFHGIYAYTRDIPYNGNDPINSIEDVDADPTGLIFINYFDPIRYAPRQYAPVLTVIGTHDEYFPTPNANLMELAITSAGKQANFEKRLWLLPNSPHQFDIGLNLLSLYASLNQWLNYCFGNRDQPLATPQIALSDSGAGLKFEIQFAESSSRLAGALVKLYAATRIDTTVLPASDFKEYTCQRDGDSMRFIVQLPLGEKSQSGDLLRMDNVLYFSTATDSRGLAVSSLMYKADRIIDLSTDFAPTIRQFPNDTIVAPVPPKPAFALTTGASMIPLTADASYQGLALTSGSDTPIAVAVEARTPEGRLAAAEGLINPSFVLLPQRSQQVFLAEQWLGPGARQLNGSIQLRWNSAKSTSLSFRGNVSPPELEGIGPAYPTAGPLWVPLAPEQDKAAQRRLRIIVPAGSSPADVEVVFRDASGIVLKRSSLRVTDASTSDVSIPQGTANSDPASVQILSPIALSARVEVTGARDPWSIDAQPSSAVTKIVQPHLEWNGLFTTRLLVLNTSSAPAVAKMRIRTAVGADIAQEIQLPVAGNAVESKTIESLFGISSSTSASAGWLDVEDAGKQLLIFALAVNLGSGAAASSLLLPAGSGTWWLPFFVENSGYYTGLALANPGDVKCNITITAYDKNATVLGKSSTSLEPHQSRTKLVYQWIAGLPADDTGYLVIEASSAIGMLSYFGTSEGASLAAIPFSNPDSK